ncbi:hypothetical protein IQ238_14630 [Pleurocapsales cyanobacterium LEGE 06147]|nr:hypothetical protein [Pleurocapsales cyanobacterium LEGE 06147]
MAKSNLADLATALPNSGGNLTVQSPSIYPQYGVTGAGYLGGLQDL